MYHTPAEFFQAVQNLHNRKDRMGVLEALQVTTTFAQASIGMVCRNRAVITENKVTKEERRERARAVANHFGLTSFLLDSTTHYIRWNDVYKGVPEILFTAHVTGSGLIGDAYTPEEIQEEFYQRMLQEFPEPPLSIDVAYNVNEGTGRLETRSSTIDITTLAKSSFYPMLSTPLEQFCKDYMASPVSVMVLYGPPGTGKSTLLRTLIHQERPKTLLSYRKEVFKHVALASRYFSGNYDLLIVEDADEFIVARERGNSLMQTLLNDTEGVANGRKVKIVISTNLASLNSVDEALLRPGRCFAKVKFDLLDADQANAVAKEMGKDDRIYSGEGRWALSEVLNPVREEDAAHRRHAIGFGRP